MKKYSKIFLISILVILLSTGSFFLGTKVSVENSGNGNSESEILGKTSSLMNLIDKKFLFDVDDEKLKNETLKGLVKGLDDPYSMYLDKEELEKLQQDTTGEYAGVGLVVTVSENDEIQVVSSIKDSPAYEQGLKTGDIITKIDSEVYTGEQLNDAVSVMKGKEGETVTLSITRKAENKEAENFDVTITRKVIHLVTVDHSEIDDIGYISISSFNENTDEEFKEAFEDLKKEDVKGIVIDLRGNPGGLLDSTVSIADYLLPEGLIVKTVDKDGNEEKYESDKNEQTIPLTVLINGGSASASELLTGALQDYEKATVIGTQSFGKGIVQSSIILKSIGINDDGAVNITTAEYFTPKGNRIHKKGVTPDKVVEIGEDILIGPDNLDLDTQLKMAVDTLTEG